MAKEAVKVQVSVAAVREDPEFKGVWAGGVFWPAGDVQIAVLESDDIPEDWLKRQKDLREKGDQAGGPVTDATGKIIKAYTLEQKLAQLYTLEGRKFDLDSRTWSDPGFEITDTTGSNPAQPKPNPRAPIAARFKILDKRDSDGVWESERAAAAASSGAKGATPPRR